jgi:hypothetical protein
MLRFGACRVRLKRALKSAEHVRDFRAMPAFSLRLRRGTAAGLRGAFEVACRLFANSLTHARRADLLSAPRITYGRRVLFNNDKAAMLPMGEFYGSWNFIVDAGRADSHHSASCHVPALRR